MTQDLECLEETRSLMVRITNREKRELGKSHKEDLTDESKNEKDRRRKHMTCQVLFSLLESPKPAKQLCIYKDRDYVGVAVGKEREELDPG